MGGVISSEGGEGVEGLPFRGLKGRKVVERAEERGKGRKEGDIMTRRGDRPRSLKTTTTILT